MDPKLSILEYELIIQYNTHVKKVSYKYQTQINLHRCGTDNSDGKLLGMKEIICFILNDMIFYLVQQNKGPIVNYFLLTCIPIYQT